MITTIEQARSPYPHTERLQSQGQLCIPDAEFFDRLQERIQSHHSLFQQVAPDYVYEILEFGHNSGDAYRYKARPYGNWDDLVGIQQLGHRLRNNSTAAIAVHENFTSYAIGNGITYEVSAKKRYRKNSLTQRQVDRAQEAVNQFLSDWCWAETQEESLDRRLLASGDVFRQWDRIGRKVDWAFIDSHEVRPPTKRQADVAPFGIEYETVKGKPNVRRPKQYWVNDNPVPARNMQHLKINSDSRDPRGLPLLWMGYPSAKEIDELDYAAAQAALTYARHTAVYQYDPLADPDDIKNVARAASEVDDRAKEMGKLNAGGSVHHALKYTVNDLAGKWNGLGFIELIDFKARSLGNLASVPEFIVTGKADTGSRNTLISAEAPLTRRVERIASKIAKLDVDLLWWVIAVAFGKADNDAWLEDMKRRITIKPSIGTPDGRDAVARERSIMDRADRGYGGPLSAIRELGEDPEVVAEEQRQWAEMLGERDEALRDAGQLNRLYSAEELKQRYDTLAILISAGMTEDEALVRLGLDQIEDRTELDAAIQRRRAAAEQGEQDDDDNEDEETNPDDPSNKDVGESLLRRFRRMSEHLPGQHDQSTHGRRKAIGRKKWGRKSGRPSRKDSRFDKLITNGDVDALDEWLSGFESAGTASQLANAAKALTDVAEDIELDLQNNPKHAMRELPSFYDSVLNTMREGLLTEGEEASISWYSSVGYDKINKGLRSGDLPKDMQRVVDAMDSGLEAMPVYDDEVWRLVGTTVSDQLVEGAVFEDQGFGSATAYGPEMGTFRDEATDVVINYHTHNGRAIPSQLYTEAEVLIPRGSRYRVKSRSVRPASEVLGGNASRNLPDEITVVEVDLVEDEGGDHGEE